MTYNTGNPIGSTDARDRLDNSENMDILENSTTLNAHPDRLGVVRKTRKGMELEHDNQIAAHEIEHDAQITAHEVEHNNQMQSFESDFDSRLAGMAFTRVGTFTTGATLTDMRQTLLWEVSQGGDGREYGWAGTFPKVVAAGATPTTSGGIGAGAWVDRTDDALRDEIRETVFQNMKHQAAEAGFNLVDGSFEEGANISGWPDVVWSQALGIYLQWHLDEAKTVAAGSVPTNIGVDWIDVINGVYDVLFVYGQSNALGKPTLSGYVAGFPSASPKSLMFDVNDSSIKPITQNINSWSRGSDSTSTGHAWCEFANEYNRQCGRGIILILGAEGGKSIAQLSKGAGSGSTAYYENAIAGYSALLTYVSTNPAYKLGKTFAIYHQGETDQLLETGWLAYYNDLVQLKSDLESDIGIEKFGVCLVGNPSNRLERTWEGIRQAQRKLTYDSKYAFMAFDGCPKFSSANGMIGIDGVHYTQGGLNLMGHVAAINTADILHNSNKYKTKSQMDVAQSQTAMQYDAPVKSFSGVLAYISSSWDLVTRNNTNAWWSNNVAKVVQNSDSIDVYLSGPIDNMLNINADVLTYDNILKVTTKRSTMNDGNGNYFIRLTFLADFTIGVRTDSSLLRWGVMMNDGVPSWANSMVSNSVTNGTAKLTHNTVYSAPDVTMYSNPSLTVPNASAKYAANSATESLIRVEDSSGAAISSSNSARANVHFKDMVMTPANLALVSGARIFVSGLVVG